MIPASRAATSGEGDRLKPIMIIQCDISNDSSSYESNEYVPLFLIHTSSYRTKVIAEKFKQKQTPQG